MASKKSFSVLDDGIVTLRIKLPDDKIRNAHVHEKLLCTASPVFQAALRGGFKEASSKTFTVSDVDVRTVEDFIYWLYRDKCESTPDLVRYAKLNRFADMYDIAWLKYDVGLATFHTLKAFVKASNRDTFVFPSVPQVYANSVPGDTIRKVLVGIYVHDLSPTAFKSAESEQCLSTCLEFGSDVAIQMGKVRAHSYHPHPFEASLIPKPCDKLETEQ